MYLRVPMPDEWSMMQAATLADRLLFSELPASIEAIDIHESDTDELLDSVRRDGDA